MGVIYKLTDEVVQYIRSQYEADPQLSCRKLAETASAKFNLHISKSSVHEVLKESGIVMSRGRKPKDKFSIPDEKKKQIQESLLQTKLLAMMEPTSQELAKSSTQGPAPEPLPFHEEPILLQAPAPEISKPEPPPMEESVISNHYEGAGNIFLKAAKWEMGIFTDVPIKEDEWKYYLTYVKGFRITLQNSEEIFVDMPVPLERCIREIADGLINNIRPLIVSKVSNEELFKRCMKGQGGEYAMASVTIVDRNDHNIATFCDIVDYIRIFYVNNIYHVDSIEYNTYQRCINLFFTQAIEINYFRDNFLDLKGFDTRFSYIKTTTLLIPNSYENIPRLESAVQKLNGMFLWDDEGHLINIKIQRNLN